MKKIFISQPMSGRTEQEIKTERKNAIMILNNYFEEKVEVLETIIDDVPKKATPLWYLGKAIETLATADVVVFLRGWQKYRGCRMEHNCAVEYGVRIIEL